MATNTNTFTVEQIIDIAKLSETLALQAIVKKGLYGGGIINSLPVKIYNIRKSVEWAYDQDNDDDTLFATSAYLLELCNRYYLEANVIINGSSGGGTVITPSGTPSNWLRFIYYITANDVTNGYFTLASLEGAEIEQLFASGILRRCTTSTSEISVLIPEDSWWFNPTNGRFTYFDTLTESTEMRGWYTTT